MAYEDSIDRCITLELPGIGYFDVTRDVAEGLLRQLKDKLYVPGAHDDYPVDFEG